MNIPFVDLRRVLAPLLKEKILEAMREVVEGGIFIHGPYCQMLERDFATLCHREHALGVANGTDALELAMRSCGVRPNDLVVMQANAGGYAAVAAQNVGAKAFFVDVRFDGQIDEAQVLKLMSDDILAPRAVIVTHLYGRIHSAIQKLAEEARRRGIPLIEDCSHVHGALLYGQAAGSFGNVGCFSLYPTKNLGALGDAGMIVTNDDEIARSVRARRLYGWEPRHCITWDGGRNSRLDELQAAVLFRRLRFLQLENFQRQKIAEQYCQGIRHPAISVPQRGGSDDVVHLFHVLSPKRNDLMQHLLRLGIETSIRYPIPDHRCSGLENRVQGEPLLQTEKWAKEVLCLPCWPGMTPEEVAYVIESCNAFVIPRRD